MILKTENFKHLGIYIHIPFCHSRCNYCGFYSNAISDCRGYDKILQDYMLHILEEIKDKGAKYRNKYLVDTIFIGGGTPSVMPSKQIKCILEKIRECFFISTELEITIEGNPESLDHENLSKYIEVGVNRLSIGVQSFDDNTLHKLGRIHLSKEAKEKFFLARNLGFQNINLDLMFGLPGQTIGIWERTLEEAIKLKPEHLSIYSLQIEEGTQFYREYIKGELDVMTDDLDRKMYHNAIKKLKLAGYRHYEISNFAKPGKECRHNLKYWSFEDYLGIGDSASSFINGIRFTEKPNEEFHINDFWDNVGEYMFTGLRKVEGISKTQFFEKFGKEFWDVYGDRKKEMETFFKSGTLIEEDDRLKISEDGFDISNNIMAVFV